MAPSITNEQIAMHNESVKHFRIDCWLYAFILIHLIAWTLTPILVRYNLPLDSIEGTLWGHQLEWGYDKNPFLNGWLTTLAIYLGGPSGWMIYLFSQLSVAICLWAVWQLSKQMLPPVYALLSVMLLEGIQYYNFHAIDFNDNTLELSLWALTIYFFYKALRSPTHSAWIMTGFFAGFGMMAKYYTAALLVAMALLLFRDHRKQLTTLSPYLGLLTFLIIITPHTIWLFFHDFVTVTYVFERTDSGNTSWLNHLFFPAQFTWQQFQAFFPALVLFALLFMGKKPRSTPNKQKLATFDQTFLFYVGVGPFLLTVLLAILCGIKLRAGWGMPLLSLWGIILFAMLQPHLTQRKVYRFIAVIFIIMGALLTGYSLSLIDSSSPSSGNYPGKEIAAALTQEWQNKYHRKLQYVSGSRWISGNIGFYSKDHPAAYIDWDSRLSPWIDVHDMQQKGAIFVWDESRSKTLPADVQKKFPQLSKSTTFEFAWKRNTHDLPPIKIGVAFLPPE